MLDARILAATDSAAEHTANWPSQRFACIVGGPRCGTTTLARLLKSHPDVAFSKVKEPHFFSLFDLNTLDDEELRKMVADHYLARYFPAIDPDAKVMAEGSVSYLYAPERMLPILRLWPEAKFIIAVRDPFDLIPSLHQRLVYQGDETVTDLEKAWSMIGERRAGRKVPRSCLDARQLYYDDAAKFGLHVSRFFDTVGRERCHVVVFDDLKADPAGAYRELLKFLDLPEAPLPERQKHRSSNGFKIGWLQRLLKRPPVARTILAGEIFRQRVTPKPHREPSWASRKFMQIRRSLLRWNRAPAPPVKMSAELKAEIRDALDADRQQLAKLLGRNLDHWLGGKMEPAA